MDDTPFDFEKLGQFYLGREYKSDSGVQRDKPVMYDSKDLVTHGVVLGMTGSGKTGLCISLLEEAAMDHIPAIVIDPKGDISNLLLSFPDLDAQSFKPWVNADDAAKKSLNVDEYAEKTANMWKAGLADWGIKPERIASFKKKTDINIFTPGSSAGIPVSVLSSLDAPPVEVLEDSELYAEQITNTVESLLSLIGVDDEGEQSPEAVLLGAIFKHEWDARRGLNLENLILKIQRPGFGKIGVIDLESFYPQKSRQSLALKFNSLLASPGFSSWLKGVPLDVSKLLHRDDGKPRISIFSIAHLDDRERMFFVSLLLNQMLAWMRTQRGTTSLRALLYMDEIYGFLPPTANPSSKRPMMTMLKQARAFGLGCLLATQNPVDLDYKALSNIGTWFLGRLQTEQDKLRVLDGLEGAASMQSGGFNRKEMETMLSGLDSRVFLMNNVHEDVPVLFHVRWAMNYLTGPLTRSQIKELVKDKRADFLIEKKSGTAVGDNPMAKSMSAQGGYRPVVGSGVEELFSEPDGAVYEPWLLRKAKVHFMHSKSGNEGKRTVLKVSPIQKKGIAWDDTITPSESDFCKQPEEGMSFAELPAFAMNAKNYKQVYQDFENELYHEEREEIFHAPSLDEFGEIGELEADFRIRISQKTREARDEEIAKLRDKMAGKLRTLESRMQTAEARVDREKTESNSAKMKAGLSVLTSILSIAFGRKSGIGTRSTGAMTKATSAYKQHRDVANAEARVQDVQEQIDELKAELEKDLDQITREFDVSSIDLEKVTLKPRRADVDVEQVCLLWK